MPALKYHPRPPLESFVECFWWSERNAPLATPELMLPTGAAYLVFPLHDESITCFSRTDEKLVWKRGVVHGPQSSFYRSGPKPAGAAVGIILKPGAATALLGIPASEIADCHLPLEALWGNRADRLHARLCEARSPTDVFYILEQELLARLKRPLLMHPAVAHALVRANRPHVRVEDIRRETGVSPRHFIHLFHTAMGMTPGRYFRVRRFTRVLYALAREGSRNLAGLAIAEGYSDQSHLVREFREHAGITPTRYRPADPASPHHHST